ncbi:MAG: sensor histidine kinase [Anaerolineales bacterium]|nr:sensor histidine kinase [Anaerolineales bacterium]
MPPALGQGVTLPSPARLAWSRLARAGWLVALALALVVFSAAVPGYFRLAVHLPAQPVAAPAAYVAALAVAAALASALTALLSIGLAVLLFWQRRGETIALVTAYFLLAYGISLGGPLEIALGAAESEGRRLLANSLSGALTLVPFMLLMGLFPNGQFVPRWARWLALAALPFVPWYFVSPPGSLAAVTPLAALVDIAQWALVLLAIAAQVLRYRRVSTRAERRQTQWFVFGLFLWLGLMLLSSLPYGMLLREPAGSALPWWIPLGSLAWVVSTAIIPVTLTMAITRHRLFDIELLLNRALVYGALTVVVIALYLALVIALGGLAQAFGSPLIALLATSAVAVLFQPLRERLQRSVNRLIYGERDDPYAVLAQLGQRLEASLAPEAVLPVIAETVAQALKLPYTAVALSDGTETSLAAEHGAPVPGAQRLPLVYRGETVGELLVASRAPGEPFTAAERHLLENVARQAGAAAFAVRLLADLRHSRERLVTAREEERRRLRRDLHDGLGPQLASQALTLTAIGKLLRQDPNRAEALLNDARAQMQAAIADIRRVVYDLRPPVLDDLGLVAALHEQAERYRAGGLQVTIDTPAVLPPLPAAVEVACFRIVQEALTNVVRHAAARTCAVRLRLDQGLRLEIRDDGRGFPAGTPAGVGLTAMRERAAELGGTSVIAPGDSGGTVVAVQLPLPPGAGPAAE